MRLPYSDGQYLLADINETDIIVAKVMVISEIYQGKSPSNYQVRIAEYQY